MSLGEEDGGRRALAGFFYQLLASAAHGLRVLGTPSAGNETCDVQFALEQLGQDATATGTSSKSCDLYQYKFSSAPASHPIYTTELTDILRSLSNSEKRAIKLGSTTVTFRLVSNRGLHPFASQMKTDADNDTPNDHLDLQTDKDSKADKTSQREVLKALKFESLDVDSVKKELINKARSFGILEKEMPAVTGRLLSCAFETTLSVSGQVTFGKLNDQLAGLTESVPLTDVSVQTATRDAIKTLMEDTQTDKPLVRRRIVDQIINAMQNALVLVIGDGGTGKTVAVLAALEQFLSGPTTAPPFVVFSPALDVKTTWLSDKVDTWRRPNHAPHTHETIERSLDRLFAAAGETDARPIVCLALDGIDEVERMNARRGDIREIIRYFEDQQKQFQGIPACGTLIVTCRALEDLDDLDPSGWGTAALPGELIHVDGFDHRELCDAARELPSSVATRIAARAQNLDPLVAPTLRLPPSDVKGVDETVYDALRHPVMWSCFRRLANEHTLNAILDADKTSLELLSKAFMGWFCNKAQRRNSACKKHHIHSLLNVIAAAFPAGEGVGTMVDHWIGPANRVATQTEARWMWTEAASTGVIRLDSADTWRWRHSFVFEYLRKTAS